MMVAERVFDSMKYSTCPAITGSTCGIRPKRISCSALPPEALMPSTCLRSAASMASENNFPNAPKSDTAIASTPANGPRPTTLIHTNAHISVSTPRIESNTRRTGKRMKPEGMIFRAASKLTGKATTAAMVVPSSAIDSVSPSADR